MKKSRAYLLCPFANDSSLYRGWSEQLSVPAERLENYRSDWECPDDAAILISHMHFRWEDCNILRRTLQAGDVPVLVLADGILEYRNIFENPQVAAGSIYQPVFGHKIACLGRAQVRFLEALGNPGICESVGLPRFDRYLAEPFEVRSEAVKSKQFRVLIATATNPFFDEQQKARTLQALIDLKDWINSHPEFLGRQIQPLYRLTAGLDEELQVKNEESEELFDLLNSADALITTPSTIALEGCLKHRPVAALDYHASPPFLPLAWTISDTSQIGRVIAELLDPPAPKMLFQRAVLHDQLECHSPASLRMVELVEAMIEIGRRPHRPLSFPPRILADVDHGFQRVDPSFELRNLFPDRDCFVETELQQLQAELARAILRLEQLPNELLESRENSRYLARKLNEVRDRLKSRNARVWDLRQEVLLLEKKLKQYQDTTKSTHDADV
ncbi:MAG TPA: hypothetical protein PKD64_17500 [Pirellulaceae bacterium]|nr:hypothetical protein [Pirellulaceae bacterium]HMO93984.1 hypothetical protein [Pirellulaceae bacterium]HMP70860.1 hypothetical protein [Pirellulaceae bacterium]